MKRSAAELREQMDKLFIGKPAVDTSRKRNTVYMRPELVAEIEHLEHVHFNRGHIRLLRSSLHIPAV